MMGVFPKGARFFRLPPTASHKTHGASDSFHNEAKIMAELHNESNYSFLIEALNERNERVVDFRIDQYVPNCQQLHAAQRASNVVQGQLHHLHRKTGLRYNCYAEGPRSRVDNMIRVCQLEIF